MKIWQGTVHLHSGEKIHIVLSNQGCVGDLQKRIYAITGIPPKHQKLMMSNKLLQERCKLESGSNITLHMSVSGGAENCDVCFGEGKSVVLAK